MTEHDTQFQDNAVCPFCGFEDGDSFEYNESDTMGRCPACGKSFEITVEYSVTYSTIKPDWLRLWREYNRNKVLMNELKPNEFYCSDRCRWIAEKLNTPFGQKMDNLSSTFLWQTDVRIE